MSAPEATERSDGLGDLVALFNSGPEGRRAALMIATVQGKRFDEEHPAPARPASFRAAEQTKEKAK